MKFEKIPIDREYEEYVPLKKEEKIKAEILNNLLLKQIVEVRESFSSEEYDAFNSELVDFHHALLFKITKIAAERGGEFDIDAAVACDSWRVLNGSSNLEDYIPEKIERDMDKNVPAAKDLPEDVRQLIDGEILVFISKWKK